MVLRIALPLALMSSLVNAQDVERRIDALLSRMTLEEKLGQMSQSTSMPCPTTSSP